MPKISQLPNKTTPTLADILPLLDTAAGNTKSASLSEIATAIISSIVPSGAILDYGGSVAPTGWLICDGSAINRTTYATLFGVIGVAYGAGDGSTTFNLPDGRGKVLAGYKSGDSNFGTLGGAVGEATHVLTINEMPAHTHGQNVTANSGGPAVRNDYQSDNSGVAYPQGINTMSTGGGAAHNNIQPSLTVNIIIKT